MASRRPEDLTSLPVGASSDEGPKDLPGSQDGPDRTSERVPTRRSGGPRTRRGKNASSKNAIKHGFFSKDAISAYRLDQESKHEYSRLRKGLFADWKPVGASEEIQVELILGHLVHYRSFLRFRRALVLAKTTPDLELLYERTRGRKSD